MHRKLPHLSVEPLQLSHGTTTKPNPESLEGVQNLVSAFSKIHFNIIFPAMSWFLTWSLSSGFPAKSFYVSHDHACYVSCPSQPPFLSCLSYLLQSTNREVSRYVFWCYYISPLIAKFLFSILFLDILVCVLCMIKVRAV